MDDNNMYGNMTMNGEDMNPDYEGPRAFFRRMPLEIGTMDDYNFVIPDKRLFDVADILVIRLSFAYIVLKNTGMRGEDKVFKLKGEEKVPLEQLEFIEVSVDDLDLGRAVNPSYTGKYLLFDARPRERMLFGRSF